MDPRPGFLTPSGSLGSTVVRWVRGRASCKVPASIDLVPSQAPQSRSVVAIAETFEDRHMKAYGRRRACRHNLHGEDCVVCRPLTKPDRGYGEFNVDEPGKSRARREAKKRIRMEIEEALATDSGGD